MTYVLIVIALLHQLDVRGGGNITIHTHEFHSQERCETAAKKVAQRQVEVEHLGGYNARVNIVSYCLPK